MPGCTHLHSVAAGGQPLIPGLNRGGLRLQLVQQLLPVLGGDLQQAGSGGFSSAAACALPARCAVAQAPC
jgi:hypothetical protein